MSYATPQDFVDLFGVQESNNIADRNRDGDYEAAVIQQALDTATNQIDAALVQKVPLPLPDTVTQQVRGMLKQWCLDIARYRLTGSSGTVVTDDIAERYKEAKLDLDRVIAGKLMILPAGTKNAAGVGGLDADDGTAGSAEYEAAPRALSPAALGTGRGSWMGGLRP